VTLLSSFWVILTDEASKSPNLRQAKAGFIATINNHVDLPNEFGLIPYFNFRSRSEQAKLKDEVYEQTQWRLLMIFWNKRITLQNESRNIQGRLTCAAPFPQHIIRYFTC
jgi:hypothetical protein